MFGTVKSGAEEIHRSTQNNKEQESLLLLTAQCAACKKCILPIGGRCLLAKFYSNEVIPYQNVATIRQVVDRATTLLLEIFRQQNFVAGF